MLARPPEHESMGLWDGRALYDTVALATEAPMQGLLVWVDAVFLTKTMKRSAVLRNVILRICDTALSKAFRHILLYVPSLTCVS